jgi:transcriptional regulator with XRE-family HTH domain
VRREREGKEIGLREMAKMIGVSPTYLSKVERGEFPPPAEDRVKQIAKVIGYDADVLLALAGRVSSDITEIIKRQPVELTALLRTAKGLKAEDIARLARDAQKVKDT